MDYLNCADGGKTHPTGSEKYVLDKLDKRLGDDWLKIFYRYPIEDRRKGLFDEPPDFIVLHQRQGLLVIDCYDYTIDDIERKEGTDWHVSDRMEPLTPVGNVANKRVKVRNEMVEMGLRDEDDELEFQYGSFVALPQITSNEWYGKFNEEGDNILFRDDFEPGADRFRNNLPTEAVDAVPPMQLQQADSMFRHGVIIGGQLNVDQQDGAESEVPLPDRSGDPPRRTDQTERETKRDWLDVVEKGLKRLDERQQRIGYQVPDGPQQIRGIAGSGKTVVCSMKAAKIHLDNPDWTIALTFRTKSLYQRVRKLVERFYAKFTSGAEPNWDNLHILHGWGGEDNSGMYYNVASATEGIDPRPLFPAKGKFGYELSPVELLDSCCEELLNDHEIAQIYDAIIIDEAQDFQHAFYKMCHEALVEPKRLTWAYDEAQNLATLSAPSAVDIFGRDDDGQPVVDVSTKYEGDVNATHVMRNSYRTPRQVLMTAHALGMGLYRDDGIIQTLNNQKNWRDIGYEIRTGDFRPGSIGEQVTITRPPEHSPHPLSGSNGPDDLITFEQFDDRESELEWIAERIQADIEDGLTPDDILVVGLWPYADRDDYSERLAEKINDTVDVPSLPQDETVCHFALKGDTGEFRRDGKLTISNLRMARGNQAGMVYVAGLEQIAEERWKEYDESYETWHDDYVMVRNEAFVALTRSKAWCTVTGTTDAGGIFDELEEILESTAPPDPVLKFETPNPDDLHKELSIDETLPPDSDGFW